jgi:predicted metal-binding membrane protein
MQKHRSAYTVRTRFVVLVALTALVVIAWATMELAMSLSAVTW